MILLPILKTEALTPGPRSAEPGGAAFDRSNVILMERQPIRSGKHILKFVTNTKPLYAGVDPCNFYIDRNATDNVVEVN